jgi:hypothetical protein
MIIRFPSIFSESFLDDSQTALIEAGGDLQVEDDPLCSLADGIVDRKRISMRGW